MNRYQMLIGGDWVDAAVGETFETDNLYLGAAWALVPRAQNGDVDRAVAAARKAFRAATWGGLNATARGAILRSFADLVATEADRLTEIEVRDNGKLITEMRAQLRYIPQWFHYFGGLADKIEGRVISIDKPGMVNFTREEPLGVVAAITPWNSPLMLATYGLAAGVWTQSIRSAFAFAQRLEAGTVWVNTYRATSHLSPFGGYKRSGIGRESGQTAIREYLQEKSVWIDTIGEVANPFVQR